LDEKSALFAFSRRWKHMVRVLINGRTFTLTLEEFLRALRPGSDIQVLEVR
jgi:hypothetical protein